MVKVLVGDLFESHAQTLVNTVNTVGVMGKGVALEFRKRFPDMYEDYVRRCAAGQVRLGQPYLYRRSTLPWILNFPTKGHWRSIARLSDIVTGLEYLRSRYKDWGITSLAVPPLGCGQGQLEWRVVGPTLLQHLSLLGIPVELYAPHTIANRPAEPVQLPLSVGDAVAGERAALEPTRMTPAWVALADIVSRIEDESYHWPVGRTTFQKIAYFATELGIPTGLHYARGSFGPFAPELKLLISRLVNNGILEEETLGRMFAIRPGPTFREAKQSYRLELRQWDEILDRIADLFLRIRNQDAEVAATVHFAARELADRMEQPPTEMDVFLEVKRWKQRRRPPLQDEDIAETIRNLSGLCWLHLRASPDLPLTEDAYLNA